MIIPNENKRYVNELNSGCISRAYVDNNHRYDRSKLFALERFGNNLNLYIIKRTSINQFF